MGGDLYGRPRPVHIENLPLSPRQKICSTSVKPSLEVHRETQAFLSVRKRETIGQLCSDPATGLATKITSGLLENRLEPQATDAQESFIASIFAIDVLSMPMMNTAASHMGTPPDRQVHDEYPPIKMVSVLKAAALNQTSSALCILKRRFHPHTPGILPHPLVRCRPIRNQKPCFLISGFPAGAQPGHKLMLLP
jgi:hypothetical protein